MSTSELELPEQPASARSRGADVVDVVDVAGVGAGTSVPSGIVQQAGDEPAASPVGLASLDRTVQALTQRLRAATVADDAQGLTLESLQALVAAVCEFYAADVQQRQAITPLNTVGAASATAVLMTATALLRGANLELFELGMWQSWSGMK
jgi:hypothetical protein